MTDQQLERAEGGATDVSLDSSVCTYNEWRLIHAQGPVHGAWGKHR